MRKKTVLIVDDNKISRDMLKKILESEYNVVEADNGENAIRFLSEKTEVSVIVLDIVMPVMNGYEFLQICSITKAYQNIPIIVLTADRDTECESKCLELGAWDFVAKPYDTLIIRNRIKNAVKKCNTVTIDTDQLTGIYNKSKFFRETKKMLSDNSNEKFAFVRFDIDRFSLINSFYGNSECNKLLIFIASELKKISLNKTHFTYGRIEHDTFCFCMLYDKDNLNELINRIIKKLTQYNKSYFIEPSFGIYVIDEVNLEMEEIYEKASLAALDCKEKYGKYIAFYDAEFTKTLIDEQFILNEMDFALESGQFTVYFQPKYNLKTNMSEGAEALVRWIHPKRGMILPGKFIPIFEKNGFMSRLDIYVFELVCGFIRDWIDDGKNPDPISVNLSKVDLFNPHLADILDGIIKKFGIPHKYLNLEITENACVEYPEIISNTISTLQNKGFTILMDDFGGGYLSLNILKGIIVNVLKININFLPREMKKGRSETILVSDIRMAKWLNLPVIVEGVENKEQVEFFKSIGCDYMQGFYFAKPMPVEDYELLVSKNKKENNLDTFTYKSKLENLLSCDTETENIFENSVQPAALYKYANGVIEIIKANKSFFNIFECDDDIYNNPYFFEKYIGPKEVDKIKEAFEKAAKTKEKVWCEYMRINTSGKIMWLLLMVRFIAKIDKKYILFGILNDISVQKSLDMEIDKYKQIVEIKSPKSGMLIVDDLEINRAIFKEIFQKEYEIYEAENSEQAIKILRKLRNSIEVVLLDLCMPVIDGNMFLKMKNADVKIASIATIAILPEADKDLQLNMLKLGINDYITRPFISVLVRERVKNAVDFNNRFRQMVKEYEKEVNKKLLDTAKTINNE